jgi:hypothetical protein
MANTTSLLPMLEIMGGFTLGGGGLNPSNKVFNPTKILLQPSYFVWKALTQMLNQPAKAHWVVPLAPHQNFFYPSF